MVHRLVLNSCLLAGFGLLWVAMPAAAGGVTAAQPQEPSPAQVDTARQEPVAIPPSEIVLRSDEATGRLQQIRSISRPDPNIERLREALPGFSELHARLRGEYDLRQLDEMTTRQLRDALSSFERLATQLRDGYAIVGRRVADLGASAEELRAIQARWRVTRRSVTEEGYPQALLEPISAVLALSDTVSRQLQVRLDSVLALEGRVSAELSLARDELAEVGRAQQEIARRMFRRNTPPLWRALEAEPVDVPFLQRVGDAIRQRMAILTDYFRQNEARGWLHAVLFGMVLVVTLVLRRRARSWSLDDESLRAAALVLARPFSSALLVALVLVIWIYPSAPAVVYDQALLILLVPLLRLLAGQISSRVRTALYVLAGLYVLQLVRGLLPDEWFLERLLLLLETGVALATLWWLVRALVRGSSTAGGWFSRFLLVVARVGLVVFGVSLAANVLGYIALASLLTETTLRSALVGLVLYAATQVLNGVITASVRTRVGQALYSVRANAPLLTIRARTIVGVVAWGVWLWVTSRQFGLSGVAWRAVLWVLDRGLSVGNVAITLGDVVVFAVSVWIAVLLSRLVRELLDKDVLTRVELPRGVSASVSRLIHYAILGLGLVFAFAAAGIDLSSLTIVIGALGVGIGFGLQNVVNNFVSGLILIFERPINLGDTIQLESLLGTVKRVGIRASTVRTYEGADVIVPNADLISGRLVNWTLSDRLRRIEVEIGVKYGTDPERVIEILKGVANGHGEVLGTPEPQALFTAHGDSSLNFLLRFWTANFDNWWVIKSDVTTGVNRALKDAGIEIPFPQRDLHLRSVDPTIGLPGAPGRESTGRDARHEEGGEKRRDSD
jgi:potassium efflux system protein